MDILPGKLAKLGLLLALTAFAGLGIWAATAPIQGAVVTVGLVKSGGHRKTIQHNEGGIVKAILVRDGDHVARGQPLILLEDASVSAGFQLVRGTLDAEMARLARLQAEAVEAQRLTFPAELTARGGEADVADLMARELALFENRRHALQEQTLILQSQIDDIAAESNALRAQLQAEEEAGNAAEEELRLYESLREQQFVSTARLLAQKRLVSEYQSREEQRRAEIARASQRRKELRLHVAALRNDYTRAAAEGLKENSMRLIELRERLLPSHDALRRQTISAPVAGRVLGLRVHTPGAGIGPREPLLDIVPEGDALVIEAQVGVDAIKQLRLEQPADIRFTALPYRSTPLIMGSVVYISPDVLIDQKSGVPAYQIHIRPDVDSLKAAKITRLEPGMAAELYIRTEARTPLEYLLRPVTDTAMRAFREQ